MSHLYSPFNRKGNSKEHKDSSNNTTEHHDNQYIRKEAENDWVVLNKAGEVMSHHETREKAEASFSAMEMHKHE